MEKSRVSLDPEWLQKLESAFLAHQQALDDLSRRLAAVNPEDAASLRELIELHLAAARMSSASGLLLAELVRQLHHLHSPPPAPPTPPTSLRSRLWSWISQ